MQTLTGPWKIARDEKNIGREERWFEKVQKDAVDAPVPGLVQQVYPKHHGVSWYWCTFRPQEKADRNHRCSLRFGAVYYLAEVWLNGTAVGGHEGGETPFSLDVTAALRPGADNLLCVRVVNLTSTISIDGIHVLETPGGFCRPPGGGIIRPVELLQVPIVHIEDIFAQPNAANGKIDVLVTVVNTAGHQLKGRLVTSAGPAKTGEVADLVEAETTLPTGESTHRLTLTIKQHRLWSLDDPQLYQVRVGLETCGKDKTPIRHEKTVRCGFRDLRVIDGFFYLNGKRIFLRSMHTGAWFPPGGPVPDATPDFPRRDLILAKASGFNMVRYIAGVALQEQLDCADEIGLMIYEESLASWGLADSPHMARRYDQSLREMILRDRNHPSITIWGLLNETNDGPVFRHVKDSLGFLRSLDKTRLVLLSSGRWDRQWSIGSVSNPGSREWEHQWGGERPGAPEAGMINMDLLLGYIPQTGDAHAYTRVPQTDEINHMLRTLGHDTKPVFLSEYGIGSLGNPIRELRHYEQAGLQPNVTWAALYPDIVEKFLAEWKRFGMEDVYPFPEDVLRESQRLHSGHRLMGFDLIRSNPNLCGFNLTSMLDSSIGAEGTWSFWRELKPGVVDALSDGWAPLRWCLFVNPRHGYVGRRLKLEAVLANEDVLPPGEYPVALCIFGPTGVVWKHKITLRIPKPPHGEKPALAVPVFTKEVRLDGPPGEYTFAANMERGGAPAGGRLKFFLSEPATSSPAVHNRTLVLWGVEKRIEKWLTSRGFRCRPFTKGTPKIRELILVGNQGTINADPNGWRELARRMACGSVVVFLSPHALDRGLRTTVGTIQRTGTRHIAFRDFPVPNVPADEQATFKNEFYGTYGYLMTDMPPADYFIEVGMCEANYTSAGKRVFDVIVNGVTALKDFDICKEAGGDRLAVVRKFKVRPKNGKVDLQFVPSLDNVSLSRLRVFDANGTLIAEDSVTEFHQSGSAWLPLANKGKCTKLGEFGDWLYHKECVAKPHPIFNGLPGRGIMDWNYYGQIIPHHIYSGQDTPDDVAAAAFAVGFPDQGGFVSGLLVGTYRFGAGRFILNTLRILENLDLNPAADRLLLNMIRYATELTKGPVAPLPKNFEKTLKAINYLE
jgi:hypothetical protein